MSASGEDLPEDAEGEIGLDAATPGFSRELRRLLILLAAAATIFLLLYFTPLGALVRDIQHLRTYLAGDDLWAELTYAGIVLALVAVGLPRLMFYVLGGLAFGFWWGLALAQTGALIGSWITFWAVRHGGRGWFQQRFGHHRLVGRAFRVSSSVKAVIMIRQLPLTSLMINGGLALGEVSTRAFLVGTFIGYLPQGIVAALVGSGVVDERAVDALGKLAAAAAVLLFGAWLLWRRRAGRAGKA